MFAVCLVGSCCCCCCCCCLLDDGRLGSSDCLAAAAVVVVVIVVVVLVWSAGVAEISSHANQLTTRFISAPLANSRDCPLSLYISLSLLVWRLRSI